MKGSIQIRSVFVCGSFFLNSGHQISYQAGFIREVRQLKLRAMNLLSVGGAFTLIDEPISRADRLAFLELFKEIAAIGRQARERRAAEAAASQILPKTESSFVQQDEEQL